MTNDSRRKASEIFTREGLHATVDRLLGSLFYKKQQTLPIDVFRLAERSRITALDFRPMIFSGGLAANDIGFRVYIQDLLREAPLYIRLDSLSERPSLTPRQRFTLAHEIAHTFYIGSNHQPHEWSTTIDYHELEKLCDEGANLLLLPRDVVISMAKDSSRISIQLLDDIAARGEVSIETALISLTYHCSKLVTDDAILLIRYHDAENRLVIDQVLYGNEVPLFRRAPKRGESFWQWFPARDSTIQAKTMIASAENGEHTVSTPQRDWLLRKRSLGDGSFLLEISGLREYRLTDQ